MSIKTYKIVTENNEMSTHLNILILLFYIVISIDDSAWM